MATKYEEPVKYLVTHALLTAAIGVVALIGYVHWLDGDAYGGFALGVITAWLMVRPALDLVDHELQETRRAVEERES